MSDKNQGLYPTDVIANLLCISERRVEQLVKKKIIPKAGRGVFDLGSTVQSYIRYLQGICSGAIKCGEPSELDQRLLAARVLERESKARQAKYRADAMERDLRKSDLLRIVREIPEKVSDRISRHYFSEQLYFSEQFSDYVKEIFLCDVQNVVNEILQGCEKP